MLHQCSFNQFALLLKRKVIFTSFDCPKLINKSTDLSLIFTYLRSSFKCVYEINQTCGDNKELTPLIWCYLLGSFSHSVITSTITDLSMLAKFETSLLKPWVLGNLIDEGDCTLNVACYAHGDLSSQRLILMWLMVRHQGEKKGAKHGQ